MRSKIKNPAFVKTSAGRQKFPPEAGQPLAEKIKSVEGFSSIAVLVVAVAIILSLVAVFVLKGSNLQQKAVPSPAVAQDPQVKSLETLSNSDDVSAIDKDTNDTNLDNIDAGLDEVNKQIPNL